MIRQAPVRDVVPQRAGSWQRAADKRKGETLATGLPPLVRRSRLVPQELNRTVRAPRSADDSAARFATAWLLPFQNRDLSVPVVASQFVIARRVTALRA